MELEQGGVSLSVWVVTPDGLKDEADLRVEYLGADYTLGGIYYWWKCLLCDVPFISWERGTPTECPHCQ